MEWYLGVWKKYAVFEGRARRTEYWMFFLFNFLISFVLGIADSILLNIARGLLGSDTYSGSGPLGGLYALAVLIPSIAVGVRRMHDSDHSGWWIIVPFVNLVFLLIPGTPGPNRFGPDPRGAVQTAIPAVAAGWHPDPYGRHEYRYWDSTKWTASVSDAGVTTEDPV